MIKFLLVCLIAFAVYKFAKPLVEFAAVVLLVILVSYGVSEHGEDIINYFSELYGQLVS
jgi:Ca2+/H+ antiporter